MMKMEMRDGEPIVVALDKSPSVYLDHCAMMDLADEPATRDRFVSWIEAEGGTLAISLLTLMEFSNVGDDHIACVDDFLDRLFPNIFVIDHDFFAVMKRELECASRGDGRAPHCDPGGIRIVTMNKPAGCSLLSVKGLLPLMKSESMTQARESLATTIVSEIKKIRDTVGTNEEMARRARRPAVVPTHIPRITSALERELLQRVAFDTRSSFTSHDAIDLCHTVVPVAYCDYVLLDRRWASLANQAVASLQTRGQAFRSARVTAASGTAVSEAVRSMQVHWASRDVSQ